jgi:hypothetical protein
VVVFMGDRVATAVWSKASQIHIACQQTHHPTRDMGIVPKLLALFSAAAQDIQFWRARVLAHFGSHFISVI